MKTSSLAEKRGCIAAYAQKMAEFTRQFSFRHQVSGRTELPKNLFNTALHLIRH